MSTMPLSKGHLIEGRPARGPAHPIPQRQVLLPDTPQIPESHTQKDPLPSKAYWPSSHYTLNTGVTHFTKDLLLFLVLLSFNDEYHKICPKAWTWRRLLQGDQFCQECGEQRPSSTLRPAPALPGTRCSVSRCPPAVLLLGLLPRTPPQAAAPAPNYRPQQLFLPPIPAMQMAQPLSQDVRLLSPASKKGSTENQTAAQKERRRWVFSTEKGQNAQLCTLPQERF